MSTAAISALLRPRGTPNRAGLQLIGGLDPAFRVNARGGPGYLGAMACHYLDGALMAAAAAWLLARILLIADADAQPQ